jgi:hypothetical protein
MFYQKIASAAVAIGIAATLLNAARSDWKLETREAIRHTFSGDRILDVDDVDGSIEVTGDGGNTIRVEGEKIIHAANQAEMDRAKRDVRLDVNEKDGIAQLYVNGPFRGNRDSSDNHGFHEHYDGRQYEVEYNFNIHVPRDTELRLQEVNGSVRTSQTNGRFDLHSVNGALTMSSIAGSGTAKTVNGRITISFRENPRAPSEFQTVNGAVEASFPPNLSADLRLKTFNGQVLTDFETTALPQTPGVAQRQNGKFLYKSDGITSVRVGAGGPELKFETLNGTISIRRYTPGKETR